MQVSNSLCKPLTCVKSGVSNVPSVVGKKEWIRLVGQMLFLAKDRMMMLAPVTTVLRTARNRNHSFVSLVTRTMDFLARIFFVSCETLLPPLTWSATAGITVCTHAVPAGSSSREQPAESQLPYWSNACHASSSVHLKGTSRASTETPARQVGFTNSSDGNPSSPSSGGIDHCDRRMPLPKSIRVHSNSTHSCQCLVRRNVSKPLLAHALMMGKAKGMTLK